MQNSKVSQREIDELEELLEDEKSHARQWKKHLLAIFIISISLLVNLIRNSQSGSFKISRILTEQFYIFIQQKECSDSKL